MPVCRYGKYCYSLSDEHWRKYSHPERSSRTKIRLFHGTTSANATSIRAHGFKPSTGGRLGPGVYFTVRDAAMNIAKYRGNEHNHSIIEVEADVGHVKLLTGNEEDRNGRWASQGYHSCKTEHPGWAGHRAFPEWCINDISRLRIVG